MLLRYGSQCQDPTGHLLQANMEAFCMEAGLQGDIFQFPLAISEYLTKTWFTSKWMQCKLFEVELNMGVMDFKPAQTNNKELTRAFLQVGYQKTELQSLNKCWMFLQLIYVSDICNRIGTEVEQAIEAVYLCNMSGHNCKPHTRRMASVAARSDKSTGARMQLKISTTTQKMVATH